MDITPREIAELTPQEQRNMSRWIGEDSRLAELAGKRARCRRVRHAKDMEENGVDLSGDDDEMNQIFGDGYEFTADSE